MQILDKNHAAEFLGVPMVDVDRHTREGHLHPIFSSKGGQPEYAD
jgi:hypothetical protein